MNGPSGFSKFLREGNRAGGRTTDGAGRMAAGRGRTQTPASGLIDWSVCRPPSAIRRLPSAIGFPIPALRFPVSTSVVPTRRHFLKLAAACVAAPCVRAANIVSRAGKPTDIRVERVAISFEDFLYRSPVKFAGAL